MVNRRSFVWCLVVIFSANSILGAVEIEGIKFPAERRVGQTSLVLNNVGLMRYNVVIKAMVAGLYLGEGVDAKEALSDVPKRIEIHYFWSLQGDAIVDASTKLLAANVSTQQLKQLKPEIDQMHKLYQNVKAGDRYSLTYIPGVGTELALNGQKKGVVPGAEFAEAYFSIWLGKKPMDISLRDQLIKKN